MILVLEAFNRTNEIKCLGIFSAQFRQNTDLDLSLTSIWWMVLQDFYCAELVGSFLPTFYHLSKRPTTEKFEHFVSWSCWTQFFVGYNFVISFVIAIASSFWGLSRFFRACLGDLQATSFVRAHQILGQISKRVCAPINVDFTHTETRRINRSIGFVKGSKCARRMCY